MTPGDKLTIIVPPGKRDPVSQVRVRKALSFPIEIVTVDETAVRVKCDGCYPPTGFKVTMEHWAEAWEPFAQEGAAT